MGYFKVKYTAQYVVEAESEENAIEKADKLLNENLQNNYYNEVLDTKVVKATKKILKDFHIDTNDNKK